MLKKLVVLIALILVLLPKQARAQQPYELAYVVTYTLGDSDTTDVQLDVKITNPRSDLYVEKFSLTLPAYFEISDIQATSAQSEVNVDKEFKDNTYTLTFQFTDPDVGKNSENNLKITYKQKKLVRRAGTVVEAILPTLAGKSAKSVDVIVKKSPDMKQALSLAKPRPTENNISYMTWSNIQTPSLYILFGESQLYDLHLTYNLKNPKLTQSYMDIALPPETLYQSIFIKKLDPQPTSVAIDEDGNYLARYSLDPREEKQVLFDGSVQVFVKPQTDMIPFMTSKIQSQKKYLLQSDTYWNIDDYVQSKPISQLKSVSDVYHYVVDTLDYSFSRVSKDIRRLGAAEALQHPQSAVCTEFTDTFVALAREKGIMAREIEGYGFSQDERILPLSLVTDVLHAWPEFYDGASGLWRQLDPTWEKTSGIDFFSGFDVNHITFAIHGKDSAYPLPAGMYKTSDSRDVHVSIASDPPTKTYDFEVKDTFSSSIAEQKDYFATVTVKNMSSVFAKNRILDLSSDLVTLSPSSIPLEVLAPYEERTYTIRYQVPSKGKSIADITMKIGSEYESKKVLSIHSRTQDWVWYTLGAIAVLLIVLGGVTSRNRKRKA